MQWAQWREWANAPNMTWSVGEKPAGEVTEVGPLSFLKIYDAGHMVPMDQAANSLDMLFKFTRGDSFADDDASKGGGGGGVMGMKGGKNVQQAVLRAGRKEGMFGDAFIARSAEQ